CLHEDEDHLQSPTLLSTPILNRGGYFGEPMRSYKIVVLHYVPGPEEPQTPPAPQDEDEHEPMLIQPHDPNFMQEPIYLAYIPLEDKHDDETKDGLVDYPMDEGDDGDDDDGDSSRDGADDKAENEEDEEEEDEEEHLAPTDSTVVIPTDKLFSSPKETEPVMPPPSTNTTTGARITVRLQAAISFPPEAEVERFLAMPTPSPSPLTSLSPPSAGEHMDRCTAGAASLLPPPLHMPPPVNRRDDIPETEMPPHKRLCLSTLGSRDTWVDLTETVPEIAPITMGKDSHIPTSRCGLAAGRLTYRGHDSSLGDHTDYGGGGLCCTGGLGSLDMIEPGSLF
nr:hypothetical protein [Tanacetum cinerariifolium]